MRKSFRSGLASGPAWSTSRFARRAQTAFAWRRAVSGMIAVLALTSQMPAPAEAQTSCDNPRALGVSRIVEIDPTPGPRYGLQQYKENDFLRPGEIVLTFDDGPLRPHTQPILNALEAQCTKATFFMVGSQAIADPDMVKKVIARGHTVGSHTWSHAFLHKVASVQARKEIELGLSAVTAAAGQPVAPFFRFPYLADTRAMLDYTRTRGFGIFSIDVDSQDWKTKNAASVHRDVLRQLEELGKGIILFHDIQPATAQALPGLLEALRVKGYKVVQLKSKTTATTLPEFDALARDVGARARVASASKPLSNRSMTFGAAQPGVLLPSPGPSMAAVQQGAGRSPSSAQQYGLPQGVAAPQLQPPVGVPAPQPSYRPPSVPDWRDTLFNR
jgi:peptidoglycan-N-acetylglucosamine deacetylase